MAGSIITLLPLSSTSTLCPASWFWSWTLWTFLFGQLAQCQALSCYRCSGGGERSWPRRAYKEQTKISQKKHKKIMKGLNLQMEEEFIREPKASWNIFPTLPKVSQGLTQPVRLPQHLVFRRAHSLPRWSGPSYRYRLLIRLSTHLSYHFTFAYGVATT